MTSTSPGKAAVTGASREIGAVYAERLAQRGHDLLLVARDVEQMNAMSERVRTETGREVEVLKADLTHATDLAGLSDRLAADTTVTVLVNNAGATLKGPRLDNDLASLQKLIALNMTAPTVLAARAFVQRVRSRDVRLGSMHLASRIDDGELALAHDATKNPS